MKNLLLASIASLGLAGCITDSQIASADTKLRDKCAYLQSGVAIARIAASFYAPAAPIATAGADLIDEYCTNKPITNLPAAMDQMEKVIVAVRPIAAKPKK